MKRRRFLEYTGVAATTLFVGRMLNPAGILAAGKVGTAGSFAGGRRIIRMNGGRCLDHRFFNNDPTLSFEREIFGV